MKIAFYTLGCKVNQYESQAMGEQMQRAGFQLVPAEGQADVYVVNSCTVTATSDQKTRQAVRRLKRQHPEAIVVLTGCMPQAYPENTDGILPEADIILGNRNSERLAGAIDTYLQRRARIFEVKPHEAGEAFASAQIHDFQERTRANVKIQDGCNRFCSYCIIPAARGRVRSKPLSEIRRELTQLAQGGFLEIVLVGINLSSYGQDIGASFCDAVEAACSVDGIRRVRLGSLEPDHMTPAVVERLSRLPKLCPQFHISLQSGCDTTLRRMNRHYTAAEYESLCSSLRACFPNASLTTDIMVGFAGETQEEFEESLAFAKRMLFEKVHVFPYSIRPGTRAAAFPEQVSKADKERRSHRMTEEMQQIRHRYLEQQIGTECEILIETKTPEGRLEGYSPNYLPVMVQGDPVLCRTIQRVRIDAREEDHCIGTIL